MNLQHREQQDNVFRALSASPNAAASTTAGGGWIQVGHDIDGEAVAMSADGSRVAIADRQKKPAISGRQEEGRVSVYELERGLWSQLGSDITMEPSTFRFPVVAMSAIGTRIAISFTIGGRLDNRLRVYELVTGTWIQIGSDIVQNTGRLHLNPIAMSADGNRVALLHAAPQTSAQPRTLVRVYDYVYSRSADGDDGRGEWVQAGNDLVAHARSFDMSSDGNRIAIGERVEYVGEIVDRAVVMSSNVAVYDFMSGNWSRRDTIHGYNGSSVLEIDIFDRSVAISPDGNRVALSTRFYSYNAFSYAGGLSSKVAVFALMDGRWTQIGSEIDGETDEDELGFSMAMSADGNQIALGAPRHPSRVGTPRRTGSVHVYDFAGDGEWMQVGSDIDGENLDDNAGWSVAMSSGGNQIIVGAPGNSNDRSGNESGYARVFTLAPAEPMVITSPGADLMPEPSWWPRIAATFDGTNLQKCMKRMDTPPAAGQRCQRKAKTCFFGTKQCPNGVGPHPATRCFCDGIHGDRVWACAEAECPALATDSIE